MYAYCLNNPVLLKDDGGYWVETAFDIISLGMSVADVMANPMDYWAWAGFVGDVIDLVPFVTGVGEAVKAYRAGAKVISKIDDVADASKTAFRLVGSYNDLRKIFKGTGMQVHHIIEKRFCKMFSELGDARRMLCVALTPAEHRVFTKLFRDALNYGERIDDVNDLKRILQMVYKDYPQLLDYAMKAVEIIEKTV